MEPGLGEKTGGVGRAQGMSLREMGSDAAKAEKRRREEWTKVGTV